MPDTADGRKEADALESLESLEEFKNSFSYGSRSDLLFKFLKSMTPEEAGGFFQSLLRKIGQSIDDGDLERIIQHVYESQVEGYRPRPGASTPFEYDDGPFQPLRKPLAESTVALLSAGATSSTVRIRVRWASRG